MSHSETEIQGIRIGDLAKRVGLSTHVLRMWERRYGQPQSVRLPSGHRRYPAEEVDRIRLVSRALKLGFKASDVVPASREQLIQYIETRSSSGVAGDSQLLRRWMQYALNFDDVTLAQEFRKHWGKRGTLDFIEQCLRPFIKEIGQSWENQKIGVRHEHFATKLICDFLAVIGQKINELNHSPVFVVATPPGEQHGLGLEMVAIVAATAGVKVVNLGVDVPDSELLSTCQRLQPQAVCLSVSCCCSTETAERTLNHIRNQLPSGTEIVVGGEGSDRLSGDYKQFDSFYDFYDWVMGL